MTRSTVVQILRDAGYKDIYATEASWHITITAYRGRLRKPANGMREEIRVKKPASLVINLRRAIRFFGIEVTLWRVRTIGG